uniref:Transketolase N-terminal domain-containing protein n=1 Tax=Ananas comosus var. bracteatus TaxID=296719 RepID=A0A6V7P9N3_ANACO|nr:unnamed protein product [Ananas comosus var. bracteatus]
MGCAPMGQVLYNDVMRFNPKNAYWFNRDRFVLSAGHGCMFHYALFHLSGNDGVKVICLPPLPTQPIYQAVVKVVWHGHFCPAWRSVGSLITASHRTSGECRDKSESRWRQIDAKRTPSDARAAFSEEICEIADFPAGCTGTASEVYRYTILAERVLLSGWLPVPVRDLVISARSRRRSIGLQRDLVRWIRDFERNPRNPHLPDLVKVSLVESLFYSIAAKLGLNWWILIVELGVARVLDLEVDYLTLASWSLIELDRDTLHTRLGSAHECHSGVRLVLLRWCRSCQLDLLSTDQLEWIEPDSRNGAGTGVFTVPGTGMLTVPIWIGSDLTFSTVEPQVPAAAPSVDQDRGKGVAS